MRSVEELRRTDPKWAAALDRLFETMASHLMTQRMGMLAGRLDVTLNHSASALKIEFRPTLVITS